MDDTNFDSGQTPAPTGAPIQPTIGTPAPMGPQIQTTAPSGKKKLLVGLFVLSIVGAAVGGFYLFSNGGSLTPPSLEPKAKATQGFIKDAKLGFAKATKADEECFNAAVKVAKAKKVKPTVLDATKTNKGQHYIYWNGDTTTKATFKEVGCNTNPAKAISFFIATWDAANKFFVTSPHDYYLKEKAGKVLTKVIEEPQWNTVSLPQSAGFIYMSQGNTETYGFSDGRTFANEAYGICDKGNPKANGWNLFASHTKETKELFKLCEDGEIHEFFAQTSVDPVKFEKVSNDTTLKYSMVWVEKADPVKKVEDKPKTEDKPADNIYTVDAAKKTITVKYADKSVVDYKIAEKKLPTGTTLSYKESTKDKNVMVVQKDGTQDRKVGSISFDAKQKLVSTLETDFAAAYSVTYDKTTKTIIVTYLKEPLPKKNEYSVSSDQKTLEVEMSDGKKGSFKIVEKSLGENLQAIFKLQDTDGKVKPVNVLEYSTSTQKETKIGTVAFDDKKALVINIDAAQKEKYSITMDPKKQGEIVVTDIVLGAPKVEYKLSDDKKSITATFLDKKTQTYKIVEKGWPTTGTKASWIEFAVSKTNTVSIQETKKATPPTVKDIATVAFDATPAIEADREATVTLLDTFNTVYKLSYDKTANNVTVELIPTKVNTYTIDIAKYLLTVKFADTTKADAIFGFEFKNLPPNFKGVLADKKDNKLNVVINDLTAPASPKATVAGTISFDSAGKTTVAYEKDMDKAYKVEVDATTKKITVTDIVYKATTSAVSYTVDADYKSISLKTTPTAAAVTYPISETGIAGDMKLEYKVAADGGSVTISKKEGAEVAYTKIGSFKYNTTTKKAEVKVEETAKSNFAMEISDPANVVSITYGAQANNSTVVYNVAAGQVDITYPGDVAVTSYTLKESKIPQGTVIEYKVADDGKSVIVSKKEGTAAAVKVGSFYYGNDKMGQATVEPTFQGVYTIMTMPTATEIEVIGTIGTKPDKPTVTHTVVGNQANLVVTDPTDTGGAKISTYYAWVSDNTGNFPIAGNTPVTITKDEKTATDTANGGWLLNLADGAGTYKIEVAVGNEGDHMSDKTVITVTVPAA